MAQQVEIPFSFYKIECEVKEAHSLKQKKTVNPAWLIKKSKQDLFNFTTCNSNYNFNFNKYIIIGVNGFVNGCNAPRITYEVLKDTVHKKIYVEANVAQKGLCRGVFSYSSCIKIEKNEEEYQIEVRALKTQLQ
jgi:hypothetical protein